MSHLNYYPLFLSDLQVSRLRSNNNHCYFLVRASFKEPREILIRSVNEMLPASPILFENDFAILDSQRLPIHQRSPSHAGCEVLLETTTEKIC